MSNLKSAKILNNMKIIMTHLSCFVLQIHTRKRLNIWQRNTQSESSTLVGFPRDDYCTIRSRGKPRSLPASLCVFRYFPALNAQSDRHIWPKATVFHVVVHFCSSLHLSAGSSLHVLGFPSKCGSRQIWSDPVG